MNDATHEARGQDAPAHTNETARGARGQDASAPVSQAARRARSRGPRARIGLAGFRANVERLAGLVAPAATMLAVKSDAYGHGLEPIARVALDAGASSLGVLDVPAGLLARELGFTCPLFAWMHGPGSDFRAAIAARIDLGVASPWQLEAIAAASEAEGSPARVHLKLDTGLRRGGANPEDWAGLVRRAVELERAGRLRVAAAWSHLSDTSHEEDARALGVFRVGVEEARSLGADFELLHIAASSAGIDLPEARFDLVRFGIAAYGISPFHDRSGADLGLRPVMRLEAPVLSVSGGRLVAGIGYGDGMQCVLLATGSMLVAGERCEVLEVSADETVLAAPAAPVAPGDTVTVFGPGDDGEPTAEEWAEWTGTVGDELVTGVTARVPRVHDGS